MRDGSGKRACPNGARDLRLPRGINWLRRLAPGPDGSDGDIYLGMRGGACGIGHRDPLADPVCRAEIDTAYGPYSHLPRPRRMMERIVEIADISRKRSQAARNASKAKKRAGRRTDLRFRRGC